ncbi:TPA: 2-amino-4-hydroxy-6-hydroxymethyldihydropteridine diphosphokinase [Enterococcus faecalis]
MIGYVALGSNVGDPYVNLVKARNYLNEDPQIQVVASSKLYETDPYGYTDQDDFLNAVLKIDTSYTAEELLAVTQGIEQAMKRKKLIHWGPRIIDIDILLLGEQSVALPHLQVPHQELTKRSFVLIPLSDVYAEEQLLGAPIATWIQRSGNQEEVRVSEKEW